MPNEERSNYLSSPLNGLELRAVQWLDGFYSLEHLLCTRAWVIRLLPSASEELKFAALTHDAERHFPGGPSSTPNRGFDDPDYLFAHSSRSADVVEAWFLQQREQSSGEFLAKVRKFILRHEIGGNSDEDLLQAADSLSFLETFDWLVVDWVRKGHYTMAGAMEKLDWSVERIRSPTAQRLALPLYRNIVEALKSSSPPETDMQERRSRASSLKLLLHK